IPVTTLIAVLVVKATGIRVADEVTVGVAGGEALAVAGIDRKQAAERVHLTNDGDGSAGHEVSARHEPPTGHEQLTRRGRRRAEEG
ncbi:MAG TPA: YibE/F family protein, partial [Arthrobacter sp.]|nr:YibE/F family protein [Arthrobacter sp.]